MNTAMKVTGEVALVVAGLALTAYGFGQVFDAPDGMPGRSAKFTLIAGAMTVVLGLGLIGNAMGKVRM